jgi:hypothetical protein
LPSPIHTLCPKKNNICSWWQLCTRMPLWVPGKKPDAILDYNRSKWELTTLIRYVTFYLSSLMYCFFKLPNCFICTIKISYFVVWWNVYWICEQYRVNYHLNMYICFWCDHLKQRFDAIYHVTMQDMKYHLYLLIILFTDCCTFAGYWHIKL